MSPIKKIIFLSVIVISFSCGNNRTQGDLPDLSDVNKITLTYKSDFDSNGKMNLKSIDITNPGEITSLENLVSSKPTTYLYCISTGVMSLYKDSTIIVNIVFNTSDDFRHIAFNFNNKLTALELSEENAKLLERIKNQIVQN